MRIFYSSINRCNCFRFKRGIIPLTESIVIKYFIMGSQNCSRQPEEILLEAIEAGITVFQYREKGPNSLKFNEKIKLGKKLRQICLDYDIPFIINDNSELIDLLNVDGIH